jgi:hypothetical protein
VEIASITSTLYPLAALVCPVGMGAMMWVMMRGKGRGQERQPSDRADQPASVELLREEHRRLGGEIARLESERSVEADRP